MFHHNSGNETSHPWLSLQCSWVRCLHLADFPIRMSWIRFFIFPLKTLLILSRQYWSCLFFDCLSVFTLGLLVLGRGEVMIPFLWAYKTIEIPTAFRTLCHWAFLWKPRQPASPFQFQAARGSHTHVLLSAPSILVSYFFESANPSVLASCVPLSCGVFPYHSSLTFSKFPNTLSDLWANYPCTSDVLLMLIYLHCG